MKTTRIAGAAGLAALLTGAAPAWAHPSPSFHVHPSEVAGLAVVSFLVIALLALAGKPER
jgi:membrane-bound ClpP family serine protease